MGLAVAELPQGAEWTYEIKLDSLKALRHEVVSKGCRSLSCPPRAVMRDKLAGTMGSARAWVI
jgi:hypothetical protein